MRLFSRKKNWQKHGQRGFGLYQAGRFEAARREFDVVVAAGPPRDILAKVHFQRGLCSAKLGNMTAAADAYRAAVKLEPSMRDGHFNLGKALGELAKHREAIDAYTKAIEADPSWGLGYCNRADMRIQLAAADADKEGYALAVSDLDRALAADPRDWIAHFSRAIALQQLSRSEEATVNLEAFLELAPPGHPHRADVQQSLAAAEGRAPERELSPAMQRRKQQRIAGDIARIIELNNNKRYEESCKLCRGFLEMADAPDAMPIAVRAEVLPTVYGELSHALLQMRRFDESLQVCNAGIEAIPRCSRLWQTKGLIFGLTGRHQEAIGSLEKFIAFAAPEHAGMVEKAKTHIEWNRQKLSEE